MRRRELDPYAGLKTILSIWGRWAIRRESRALGYPSTSPMFRDMAVGDGFGSQIPTGVADGVGPEIYRLDDDIKRLPTVQRAALVEVYQVGGSFRQIAERMGVKRDALGGWLDKAYGTLSTTLENSEKGGHNLRQLNNEANCLRD